VCSALVAHHAPLTLHAGDPQPAEAAPAREEAEAPHADEPMAEAADVPAEAAADVPAEAAARAGEPMPDAEQAAPEGAAAEDDSICTPRSVDLPGACTFHEVRLVDRRHAGERVVRWVMGCELERILYNNDAST
jgi:hypothetical protein